MAELSKTARASLRVGTTRSRTPVAWIFRSKPGKMQTSPYHTSYVAGECEAMLEKLGDGYFIVQAVAGKGQK